MRFRGGRDLGRWGVTFEHGAGPRWPCSGIGRGLCLGPALKGRGNMSKGGPLECGVLEFGGRALSEGVRVGIRPSVGGCL